MDSLKIAADDLKGKINMLLDELKSDPRITEVNKSIAALHSLEDYLNESRTEFSGIWAAAPASGEASRDPSRNQFRQDEFYGLEALDAAKRVLKKRGSSTRFSDIVAGIKAGGGDPGNEDKLRVSLARSTMEVAKIGDDLFGLVEFYPHIKRGTPGRRKKNGGSKDEESVSVAQDSADAETPEDAGTSPGEPKGES